MYCYLILHVMYKCHLFGQINISVCLSVLNLLGQIDLPIALETSHYLFTIGLMIHTTGLGILALH